MNTQIPKIRTMVVDDEMLGRANLEALLREDPEIQLVGTNAAGAQAIAAIKLHKPELLFLDIQMPGVDGFELLGKLHPSCVPQVIFVTAYDEYALRAFNVGAIDYLLKPFNRDRFAKAVARGKAAVRLNNQQEVVQQMESIIESVRLLKDATERPKDKEIEGQKGTERLSIRCDGEIHILAPEEIYWLEADGDYLHFHTEKGHLLVRMTLVEVMAKLPAKYFVQIHRGTVVNLRHLRKAYTIPFGEYNVVLTNRATLKVSRTYVRDFKSKL